MLVRTQEFPIRSSSECDGYGEASQTDFNPYSVLSAFRAHGGVLLANEFLRYIPSSVGQSVSKLARSIVDRRILAVEWRGDYWLPLFQLDLNTGAVRPDVAKILETLEEALTPLEKILWFIRSNVLLGGQLPIHEIEHGTAAVLNAARADRDAAHRG